MRQEQTHSTRKSDAERLLRGTVTAAAQGRPAGPDVETTVEDLIAMLVTDYKNNGRRSLRRINSSVGHLRAFFGESLAVAVTEDRIASYVRQRKEAVDPRTQKRTENATINRELAALKRMFRLTPGLRAVLEEQREQTKALEAATGRIIPLVFHRNGKPIRDFRSAWKTACAKAGVAGRLLHDFRRSAVRNLERAGVPRSTAMKMVGHKTEAIYRRYAIVDEGMMREGAEKLATFHAAERMVAKKHVATGARFSGPEKSGTSRDLNETEVQKG